MIVVLGISLLLVALVVHEAGHAIAMTRRGIEIKEAGVGLPITGKYRLTFHPKSVPFPLVLTPALLGAYVQPTDEGRAKLEGLSYKDRAVCYSAGVVMNIIFGGLLACTVMVHRLFYEQGDTSRSTRLLFIIGGITLAVVLFRRVFSLVLPVFGVLLLILVIATLADSMSNVQGPGGIVKTVASSHDVMEALLIGGDISLSLAIFNMLPLMPLDGGHVVRAFLETRNRKKAAEAYSMATAVVIFGFFLFVIVKDFV